MTPPLTTIDQGEGSGIVQARRTVVRDASAWRALWAAHAGPAGEAPAVDFGSQMVAAVFAGERATPGFRIEITAARREGQALMLTVTERTPVPGVAAQVIVTPFHIAALPRHDGEVRFEGATGLPSRTAGVPPPEPLPRPPARNVSSEAPSSTGLHPNTAAALAYLAGPASGLLILLVERANGYVRFHAWQAIIGLGGLGALAVTVLITSFLTLLLSPRIFTAMYWLSGIVGCVWLAAWAVCLYQAFTGRQWKMPIVGRYAERLSARA